MMPNLPLGCDAMRCDALLDCPSGRTVTHPDYMYLWLILDYCICASTLPWEVFRTPRFVNECHVSLLSPQGPSTAVAVYKVILRLSRGPQFINAFRHNRCS